MDQMGPLFRLYRGVKQGNPLSPNLFNAILEVIRDLDWENFGIKIDGVFLNHLRFADDIVLISEKRNEIEILLNELIASSAKAGLQINISKTKSMSNVPNTKIFLGNVEIEKKK